MLFAAEAVVTTALVLATEEVVTTATVAVVLVSATTTEVLLAKEEEVAVRAGPIPAMERRDSTAPAIWFGSGSLGGNRGVVGY